MQYTANQWEVRMKVMPVLARASGSSIWEEVVAMISIQASQKIFQVSQRSSCFLKVLSSENIELQSELFDLLGSQSLPARVNIHHPPPTFTFTGPGQDFCHRNTLLISTSILSTSRYIISASRGREVFKTFIHHIVRPALIGQDEQPIQCPTASQ